MKLISGFVASCVLSGTAAIASNALADSCYMTFDNHASVAALPQQAESTFVVGPPWYQQSCGNDSNNPVATAKALNLDHYHLSYTDPNACFYAPGGHAGTTLANGSCQAYPDVAAQPRTIQNMNGDTGVTFDMGGEQFDLTGLDILPNSAQVQIVGRTQSGAGLLWNLGPSSWTFNNGARYFTSLTLQTTARSGIFNVDNVGLWQSFETHQFDNGSSIATFSDWDPGYYKASCLLGAYTTNGISWSIDGSARAHSTRCKYMAISLPPLAIVNFQNGEGRRSTTWGDWDYGFVKGECADNEAVSGISQTTSGKLSKLNCARVNVNATQCVVRNYQVFTHDQVDWAWGYSKAECADNEVVKGVSHDATGGVHNLLCCQYPGKVL